MLPPTTSLCTAGRTRITTTPYSPYLTIQAHDHIYNLNDHVPFIKINKIKIFLDNQDCAFANTIRSYRIDSSSQQIQAVLSDML